MTNLAKIIILGAISIGVGFKASLGITTVIALLLYVHGNNKKKRMLAEQRQQQRWQAEQFRYQDQQQHV